MKKTALTALLLITTNLPTFAFEDSLANKLKIPQSFINVAQKYSVDPISMYAISTSETGYNRGLKIGASPYPWTANICDLKAGRNCKGYWFNSREELYEKLLKEIQRGNNWFDVGIMQMNWHFHSHRFNNDLWLATHPLVNMNEAAKLLLEISNKHKNPIDLYSAYHAGSGFKYANHTEKRKNQIKLYAQKTLNTYNKVIANVK